MTGLNGGGLWNIPRSWLDRARDDENDEIEFAEEQHVSLGANGIMFTPYVWARGLTDCEFCHTTYINREYLTAHQKNEHMEEYNAKQEREAASGGNSEPVAGSAGQFRYKPGLEPGRIGAYARPRSTRGPG